MFDFVYRHAKIMQLILFLLILPAFIMGFGIEGYKEMMDAGDAVAHVDGKAIKQNELDNAHKNNIERLRASNPNVNVKLLDSPEAKKATLSRIIDEKLSLAAAKNLYVTTTDAKLTTHLQSDPNIASLRLPDGSIDAIRYQQLLASQNMQPEVFEESIRQQLAAQQVFQAIRSSGLPMAAVANLTLDAFNQKRKVQFSRFEASAYTNKINLKDEEIEAFYKANAPLFQSKENTDIEYVVLRLDDLKRNIAITDEEAKAAYTQNTASYASKEERRASHILINAAKDATPSDKATAKAKAQALLVQLQKAPNTFATVAKANSQDAGSAMQGGDLNFFGRASMVKPFEDAAFALKKGEMSAVVESDFGYHIILLTDIKTSVVRPFEAVKGEIVSQLQKEKAQKAFVDAADVFSNMVYEQADTFKGVAEKLKLSIQTAKSLSRQGQSINAAELNNPKLLAAIFAPDSTEKKRNTAAVDIGNKQLVSARVVQYHPVHTLPLAEVKDAVKTRLLNVRSFELARNDAIAQLASTKVKPESMLNTETATIGRNDPTTLPASVVDAITKADITKLPVVIGAEVPMQAYYVIKVTEVMVPKTTTITSTSTAADKEDHAKAEQGRSQYAQAWTAAEEMAYNQSLKTQFKTSVVTTMTTPAETVRLKSAAN